MLGSFGIAIALVVIGLLLMVIVHGFGILAGIIAIVIGILFGIGAFTAGRRRAPAPR